MQVSIECRCKECRHVCEDPLTGELFCGHPDLTVEPEWVTEEDRAEPFLPVDPDGFCYRGELWDA